MFCNLVGIVSGLLRQINFNSLSMVCLAKWFWSCTDHQFSDLFLQKTLKIFGSHVEATSLYSKITQVFQISLKNWRAFRGVLAKTPNSELLLKLFPVFHQIDFIWSLAIPCVGFVSGLLGGFLKFSTPHCYLFFSHHTNKQNSKGRVFHVNKSGSV
jgi:hypothetical protein